MGFYDDKILPHAIDFACSSPPIMKLREKVVPMAEGEILEIGMGSGVNIPLYDSDKVDLVWGLEPSKGMREKARKQVDAAPFEIRWLDLPGEEIPLADESVDTVLLTYTLCTIPDWMQALRQMRRVLKPGGKLLFCEHGRAPDRRVENWQNRLTPVWKRLAGGCHLNRPIAELIQEAGFVIESLENVYAKKTPKFAGYMYYGWANRGDL